MHYRKEVVRRYLADIELQKPTQIDVLQAMWMISKTWNKVTERTITNCFKKSGFKCEDEDNDVPLAELVKIWQATSANEEEDSTSIQLTDFEFVSFDDDLAVCGELTDDDIVTSVLPVCKGEEEESEEEENEIEERELTINDARRALNVMKSVFLQKNVLSEGIVTSINELDCALDFIAITTSKQTTIYDFFSV
ncbi:uncharacterized protein LOC126897884 [Daktulosphaira vitifoliae]|uniref:uncharacterized protein LOC126897884 n=1 Tax=Daktulosphaira vitifoliae TaxID=58002 RepID=UPI0021AAAC9B|nr:uncharacterized protein LOC126897884 [Daktulosphaira vitifoliae]